jgi:trans-2,3-dihydro-3-hydroxyanthranilate isomerase
MSLRYVIVDVFTDTPLHGNQLAVFEDGSTLTSDQMQRLAREMNLSETVFLLPPEHGGDARLRIFTPGAELPFAGHPVLGTAFVVGEARQSSHLQLETPAAVVPLELVIEDGRARFGRMRQPIPTWAPYARAQELLDGLGVTGSGLPVDAYHNGPTHVYVELPDEAAVTALKPNMAVLGELTGVCANCFAGSGRQWRARMFAPALGVTEDPATGSAAGPLALHLARHGRIAFGDEIEIHQGAEVGRPSVLYARAEGSEANVGAIEVSGAAVIVARGEFSRW